MHLLARILLPSVRSGIMVTLRSSRPAVAAVKAPPPLQRSIGRHFGAGQKASAPAAHAKPTVQVENEKKSAVKHEADEAEAMTASPTKKKRKTKKEIAAEVAEAAEDLPLLSREEIEKATTIDYPRLPFDLAQAAAHLRSVDPRFHSMLDNVELKPYEEMNDGRVRELDLFRTLATSILGQQVSWLAARAIVYRFVRLFQPDLPERPDFDAIPRDSLPFPHPLDVCAHDESFLRTAGLSGAKAKYVKDVARRFSDGRLDARRIVTMDEEACIAELVQIKGVGQWTAEMLLMFALRRGNILPVGDLGVQRGMVLFYTADRSGPVIGEKKRKQQKVNDVPPTHDADEKVPVVEAHLTQSQLEPEEGLAPVDVHETGPHINGPKVEVKTESLDLPALPQGMTAALLNARRDGKKAKGNVYLTPPEMEALAATWAPYRSVAVYMMWALVD